VVDNTTFHNAYLFYADVLNQVKDDVDFINVQFYNNDPEDTNPDASSQIIKAYNDIVAFMGVTLGMCAIKENEGVCTYCKTDKYLSTKLPDTAEYCSNSSRRLTDIIKPLSSQHNDFGGIMFWNTAGDENGVFWTPIYNYFSTNH
jgi:chitinase